MYASSQLTLGRGKGVQSRTQFYTVTEKSLTLWLPWTYSHGHNADMKSVPSTLLSMQCQELTGAHHYLTNASLALACAKH